MELKEDFRRKTVIISAAALAGLAILALAFSCRICPEKPPPAPPERVPGTVVLPVLLASGAAELAVASRSGGVWRADVPPEWEKRLEAGETAVTADGGRLNLAGETIPVGRAGFIPHDGLFGLGGRTYRGALAVETDGEGGLKAFGLAYLEDYIKGVLPSEIYPHWPMDAVMAQAIAIRTFALNMIEDAQTRSWLTTLDLAYRGAEAETPRTDRAVELTRGMVMKHGGKLFPAFFHSTCGGHTAAAEAVFGAHDIGALQPVPCGRCTHSPHFHWQAAFTLDEIAGKIFQNGNVTSIETTNHDEGGRPRFVVINGEKKMLSSEFRLALGTFSLKSAMFTVRVEGEKAHFEGRGFGHGVGLCQWGAYGLANDGATWMGILRFYYPDIEIAPFRP